MDKELLRIVIIATGMLVIIGMLFWAFIKNKKTQDRRAWYGESVPVEQDDDFDIVPLGSARSSSSSSSDSRRKDKVFEQPIDFEQDDFQLDDDFDPEPRIAVPAIIQFSIVAKADEGFNGVDMVNAFKRVGLEYGSLKIFERLDGNRLVDFGVACMVEPGTFPEKNLQSFYCPGLVFFMQPGELDDARAVFDDYVDTIQTLAAELHGIIWDHKRQPLTEDTIAAIRFSL
ncbi:MAG: cell division protein ZipA C-terminal FtsZ-binding domain-containing protein [Methylococcales bacterium]